MQSQEGPGTDNKCLMGVAPRLPSHANNSHAPLYLMDSSGDNLGLHLDMTLITFPTLQTRGMVSLAPGVLQGWQAVVAACCHCPQTVVSSLSPKLRHHRHGPVPIVSSLPTTRHSSPRPVPRLPSHHCITWKLLALLQA